MRKKNILFFADFLNLKFSPNFSADSRLSISILARKTFAVMSPATLSSGAQRSIIAFRGPWLSRVAAVGRP